MRKILTDRERLSRYKVMSNGCWIWQGSTNHKGYGTLRVGSRLDGTDRSVLAHRFAYEVFVGPIPEGKKVLHRCDHPPCINQDHLFTGTDADNSADKMAKGRHDCARGEDVNTAVLNEGKIRRMRLLFAHKNDQQLSRQFGVSDCQVNKIRNGHSWRHVR